MSKKSRHLTMREVYVEIQVFCESISVDIICIDVSMQLWGLINRSSS